LIHGDSRTSTSGQAHALLYGKCNWRPSVTAGPPSVRLADESSVCSLLSIPVKSVTQLSTRTVPLLILPLHNQTLTKCDQMSSRLSLALLIIAARFSRLACSLILYPAAFVHID